MDNVKATKLTSVEKDLVDGLEGFVRDLKTNVPIRSTYTCRRILLDLQPQAYTAKHVVATRKLLRMSQPLFAQFLGVSPKTVRAWEHGKTPSDMACRFMDEIQRNPDYWRKRVRESAKVRECNA